MPIPIHEVIERPAKTFNQQFLPAIEIYSNPTGNWQMNVNAAPYDGAGTIDASLVFSFMIPEVRAIAQVHASSAQVMADFMNLIGKFAMLARKHEIKVLTPEVILGWIQSEEL